MAPAVDFARLRQVKVRDCALRFFLGAFISVSAAFIVKGVDPRFGGVFLAFPAILPASLTLIQSENGRSAAGRNAVGAVLGGFGLCCFAGLAEFFLLHLPPFAALVLALVGWVTVSFLVYALLVWFRPSDCDRRND